MKFDQEGWLVREPGDPEIEIIRAHPRRCYSKLDTPDGKPLGLANHFTGTTGGEQAMAGRLVGAPGAPGAAARVVSWHFLNLRTGKLIQQVSIFQGAAHIVNQGMIRGKLRRPNKTLLGLENANAGHLHAVGGRYYASWKRRKNAAGEWVEDPKLGPDPKSEIPASRVFGKPGVPYQERFTREQTETFARLGQALLNQFPSWTKLDLTYEHRQFDEPRKTDPGQAWLVEVQPRALAAMVDPTPEAVYDPFADLAELPRPIGRVVKLNKNKMTRAQRDDYARAGYWVMREAGLQVSDPFKRQRYFESARAYYNATKDGAWVADLQVADQLAAEVRSLP